MFNDNTIKERICMNPECQGNQFLPSGDRPIIRIGKVCWNCKSADNLVLKDES